MARNEEKRLTELNRLWHAEQDAKKDKKSRPHLMTLKTARAVREWLPSIRRDIEYCMRHIEGRRNYTEKKVHEFERRLTELKEEYHRFVRKAEYLDPAHPCHPGHTRRYVSLRTSRMRTQNALQLDESLLLPEASLTSAIPFSSEVQDGQCANEEDSKTVPTSDGRGDLSQENAAAAPSQKNGEISHGEDATGGAGDVCALLSYESD